MNTCCYFYDLGLNMLLVGIPISILASFSHPHPYHHPRGGPKINLHPHLTPLDTNIKLSPPHDVP